MHFKYVDIFADCKSMAHKERILDKLIRDRTGFEGIIKKIDHDYCLPQSWWSLRAHRGRKLE